MSKSKIKRSIVFPVIMLAYLAVMAWIGLHIEPAKRKKHNSYALKHRIASDIRNEQHIEIYLTNNQFKHAMLLAGFMPVDKTKLNWDFRVKIV